MDNLFYVCTTQEIAQAIEAQIELNMLKKHGGVWGIPRKRVTDNKWVLPYTDDPQQAWRFENVEGYESIEEYQSDWWSTGEE
jgi:hypothetical protein